MQRVGRVSMRNLIDLNRAANNETSAADSKVFIQNKESSLLELKLETCKAEDNQHNTETKLGPITSIQFQKHGIEKAAPIFNGRSWYARAGFR